MKEHITALLKQALNTLQEQQQLPADLKFQISIEQTKNPEHGELASNIALTISKQAQQPPREIAEQICQVLAPSEHIAKTQVAGPGFINFYLHSTSQTSLVQTILEQAAAYGHSNYGAGQSIQVEFVSANPTGPLHVGHGRGAAYGACVANLLAACGYKVEREYYVNDAGRQMDILATSIWLRYLQACGQSFNFPSNGYKGEYIGHYANQLKAQQQDSLVFDQALVFANVIADEPDGGNKETHIDGLIKNAKNLLGETHYQHILELGLEAILKDIRNDLAEFKVEFNQWFSERSLKCYLNHSETPIDLVEVVISKLQAKNLIEQRDGALWFLSTQLGDDKDRVIKRANGQTTYFASDIAYHYEKFSRGFAQVINVWGADHHGYIARVKAALSALDIDPDRLVIKLVQLVSLYRGEQQVSMSTRSGEFVTLKALIDEVGSDAARFFYVMRKVEQATDFDLELAKSQSQDNPVYYVQYAHARICSMLRKITAEKIQYTHAQACEYLHLLQEAQEKQLLKRLSAFPDLVLKAALAGDPHNVVNYLRALASDYHSYYNAHKVLTADNALTQARLALSDAVRQTLANGLALLDISQPQKM